MYFFTNNKYMSKNRYYLLYILIQNKIYCDFCCSSRRRSIEIYNPNQDTQKHFIIEENKRNNENNVNNKKDEKIDENNNIHYDFKNKNEQNIQKMLKLIKNDISKSDIDEIISILLNINNQNYYKVLKQIYNKLKLKSYLNIVKINDLIYIFTSENKITIPGIHYFYFEKIEKNNKFYSNNNDIGKIEFFSNIKTDIFKILCDDCIKKNKNLPLETILKIYKNLNSNFNHNFRIFLQNDSFDEDFYFLINKEKNIVKKVSNLDSLKKDHNSNYKIIKIDSNKIEFINNIIN